MPEAGAVISHAVGLAFDIESLVQVRIVPLVEAVKAAEVGLDLLVGGGGAPLQVGYGRCVVASHGDGVVPRVVDVGRDVALCYDERCLLEVAVALLVTSLRGLS